jgi:hypothetical protein
MAVEAWTMKGPGKQNDRCGRAAAEQVKPNRSNSVSGPDGIRTRDLRLDRAA